MQLVATPTKYEEIITNYKNETEAYSTLTSAAVREFETYDDVIELQHVFIDNSEKVERWVTRDLARTIKNMVLQESKSGQAFPLRTLQEVSDRLDAYSAIGVSVPALSTQIETIIEALYDTNWENAHSIIDSLLDDVPPEFEESTEIYFLARTRAVLGLHPETSPGHKNQHESPVVVESRRFKAVTTPPGIAAPKTSELCFSHANELNYETDRKRKMYALAIHKAPSESRALSEFLYLSAKHDIEKYRHRSPNPSRGRLAITQLQFDLIAHYDVSAGGIDPDSD